MGATVLQFELLVLIYFRCVLCPTWLVCKFGGLTTVWVGFIGTGQLCLILEYWLGWVGFSQSEFGRGKALVNNSGNVGATWTWFNILCNFYILYPYIYDYIHFIYLIILFNLIPFVILLRCCICEFNWTNLNSYQTDKSNHMCLHSLAYSGALIVSCCSYHKY